MSGETKSEISEELNKELDALINAVSQGAASITPEDAEEDLNQGEDEAVDVDPDDVEAQFKILEGGKNRQASGATETAEAADDNTQTVADIQAQMAELLKQNQALMAKLLATEEREKEQKPTVQEVQDVVLSDEDFERISEDKEVFTRYVTEVAQRERQRALLESAEAARRVVNTQMTVMKYMLRNPDLTPFEDYIISVGRELEAKNPALTLQELLDQAGKLVRTKLKSVKPAKSTSSFAPGTSRRAVQKKQELTPQQKDLEELSKLAGSIRR